MKQTSPTFIIHGAERRIMKKELSFLKSYVKSFWSEEYMERGMSYDPDDLDYKKQDIWCKQHLKEKNEKIVKLEETLSRKFNRQYKLERILKKN